MVSYRVMLDVPGELVTCLSALLPEHRSELGIRSGTRLLTCWKQVVFALAWFRDRPDTLRHGMGFGLSQATAYRYLDEVIEVLAARAPGLTEVLDQAKERGLPYLILDGKVVATGRLKERPPARKAWK